MRSNEAWNCTGPRQVKYLGTLRSMAALEQCAKSITAMAKRIQWLLVAVLRQTGHHRTKMLGRTTINQSLIAKPQISN